MKQKKRNVYFLVGILVLVWGAIIVQILGGFSSDPDSVVQIQPKRIQNNVALDTMTYVLTLNYEDPFKTDRVIAGGQQFQSSGQLSAIDVIKKRASQTPATTKIVNWPKIEYGGVVKSSNSKKVGLLSVNNQEYLAKEGQEYKNILVKEITNESIMVEYENQEKIILK